MAKEAKVVSQDKLQTVYDEKQSPLSFEDVKRLYEDHKTVKHPYFDRMWKNYYMYPLDRLALLKKEEEDWRSNLKSPLTHMFSRSIYNMLMDADVRFFALDLKGDKKSAGQMMVAIAANVTERDMFKSSNNAHLLDAVVLGPGTFKTTYIYSKSKVAMVNKGGKGTTEVEDIIDTPAIRYVSAYNFVEVGNKATLNERLAIERRLIPASMIEKEYSIYGLKMRTKEVNDAKDTYVDSVDHDAIKEAMPYFAGGSGKDILDDNAYNIKDKMLEVFELHTSASITIWVNGVYHGTFGNIMPMKKIRYYTTSFSKASGNASSIGVGYMLEPIQKAFDTLVNTRIDNVLLSMNKVFLVSKGTDAFKNQKTMKLSPGKIIPVVDPNIIKEVSMSEVHQSAYAEVDALFQMAQGLTGVSAPVLGAQAKVERTAAGADLLKNAADNQLKPLLDSLSETMAGVMKDIIIMAYIYMDDATLEKIGGKEAAEDFKALTLESLVNDFDFSYQIVGTSAESKAVNRQQLMSVFQLASTLVDNAGNPMIDARAVAIELLKTFNLDFDATMTLDKMKEQLKTKQEFQELLAQQPAPIQQAFAQNTGDGKGAEPQAAEPSVDIGSATGLSQLPGADVSTEAMPNPTGNQEQPVL